ncbi:MAG: 3TM-type holin [Gammaproteobacteria bacterium]
MNPLVKFFSASTSEPIEAIGNVLDKLFTSDEEKVQAQAVFEKLKQHPNELQVELNKIEAQHRSLLVAGWRPFIGWICGLGLGNVFLINPWLQWLCGVAGPQLPLDVMMELVVTMLGFGTLRTVEKFNGKSK